MSAMNAQKLLTVIRRAYMTAGPRFDAFLEYTPGALLVVGGLTAIGMGAA